MVVHQLVVSKFCGILFHVAVYQTPVISGSLHMKLIVWLDGFTNAMGSIVVGKSRTLLQMGN